MLSIIKVRGDSMSPQYKNGDYVVSLKSQLLPSFLISEGRDYIIEHREHGRMLKRLTLKSNQNQSFQFSGLNPKSISTENIGVHSKESILGLVILLIKSKRKLQS